MLHFEDNPLSKIGVRFEKHMPDGVDFGGLCDPGHGFFCKGNAFSGASFLFVCVLIFKLLY